MSQTVTNLSIVRQKLDTVISFIESVREVANNEGAGREFALVLTKLEEARMWAGKGLRHFDTGFKESDKADDPSSHTKEVVDSPVESAVDVVTETKEDSTTEEEVKQS